MIINVTFYSEENLKLYNNKCESPDTTELFIQAHL